MSSKDTQFKKGHVPWLKGKKNPGAKNLPHAFKKGHIPWSKLHPELMPTIWNKGKKMPPFSKEHLRKLSESRRKRKSSGMLGKKQSIEARNKMSMSAKKGIGSHASYPKYIGKNHWNWIADRSKLKKREQRNDSSYCAWRREVWLRDNFTCKIANPDCKGRIEAHHILGWTAYPELRYKINNGITLCHAHHPRKRVEEAKLSPYFQKLVAEIK